MQTNENKNETQTVPYMWMQRSIERKELELVTGVLDNDEVITVKNTKTGEIETVRIEPRFM